MQHNEPRLQGVSMHVKVFTGLVAHMRQLGDKASVCGQLASESETMRRQLLDVFNPYMHNVISIETGS